MRFTEAKLISRKMDEISRFTRHVVALRLLGEGAKGWTSPEHDVKRHWRVRRAKKKRVPTATSLLTETHRALRQGDTARSG